MSDAAKLRLSLPQIGALLGGLAGVMTLVFALAIGLQLVPRGEQLGGPKQSDMLLSSHLQDHVTKKHTTHPDMDDLARTDASLIRLEEKIEGVRGAIRIMDTNNTDRLARLETKVDGLVDRLSRRVRRADRGDNP